MKRQSPKLSIVKPGDKPKKLDRGPHRPKVSPFAENKDALAGPNKGLILRVMGFSMACGMLPRRGS